MTARALGISRRRIVLTQALRNALPAAVAVLGLQVGTLLGGAVLVEAVFAWPGLGQLVERAISSRDYPLVQVLLLLSVVVFIVTQLLSDVRARVARPAHPARRCGMSGLEGVGRRRSPRRSTSPPTSRRPARSRPASDHGAGDARSRRAGPRPRPGRAGARLGRAAGRAARARGWRRTTRPSRSPAPTSLPPGGAHLLGTDEVNRDVLSRTLHGIRVDLVVVFVAVPIGALLGGLAGLLSTHRGGGRRGGPAALRRGARLPDADPRHPLTAVMGPGLMTICVVIVVAEIPVFGRLIRSAVLTVREMPYVEASRVIGSGRLWVLRAPRPAQRRSSRSSSSSRSRCRSRSSSRAR